MNYIQRVYDILTEGLIVEANLKRSQRQAKSKDPNVRAKGEQGVRNAHFSMIGRVYRPNIYRRPRAQVSTEDLAAHASDAAYKGRKHQDERKTDRDNHKRMLAYLKDLEDGRWAKHAAWKKEFRARK
jgi:hypothetical protein